MENEWRIELCSPPIRGEIFFENQRSKHGITHIQLRIGEFDTFRMFYHFGQCVIGIEHMFSLLELTEIQIKCYD